MAEELLDTGLGACICGSFPHFNSHLNSGHSCSIMIFIVSAGTCILHVSSICDQACINQPLVAKIEFTE